MDPKNVTLLDQSDHQMAKAAKKPDLQGVTMVKGDAEDLPFDADSFDRYVSAGSIEYWPEPQRGICVRLPAPVAHSPPTAHLCCTSPVSPASKPHPHSLYTVYPQGAIPSPPGPLVTSGFNLYINVHQLHGHGDPPAPSRRTPDSDTTMQSRTQTCFSSHLQAQKCFSRPACPHAYTALPAQARVNT